MKGALGSCRALRCAALLSFLDAAFTFSGG